MYLRVGKRKPSSGTQRTLSELADRMSIGIPNTPRDYIQTGSQITPPPLVQPYNTQQQSLLDDEQLQLLLDEALEAEFARAMSRARDVPSHAPFDRTIQDDIYTYKMAISDINRLSPTCDTNVLYDIIRKFNISENLEILALEGRKLTPSMQTYIINIVKSRLQNKINLLKFSLKNRDVHIGGGRKKTYKRKTQIRRRTTKTTKNLSIIKRKRKRKRKTIRKNR
tara:strand:- start:3861 stop:4532 length:672 start_codon:yes stop_codon:yes gene_type:complete